MKVSVYLCLIKLNKTNKMNKIEDLKHTFSNSTWRHEIEAKADFTFLKIKSFLWGEEEEYNEFSGVKNVKEFISENRNIVGEEIYLKSIGIDLDYLEKDNIGHQRIAAIIQS